MNNSFSKFITLDEFSHYGEPTIQLVRLHEYNKFAHVKVASEALDYIKSVRPIPGKTVILVLAMTAGEFYGPNRNGDAWPERPLRVKKTIIGPDEVLPKHYRTFESDANVFRHHINKDPEKRIGQILKAFYNWPMHRVELLIALDNKLADDVVQEIESGKFPAVSMGCRVKYDVCFREGTLVETDCGPVPIEDIEVGNYVRTHTGNLQPVTACLRHIYSGTMYSVKVHGVPEITHATANHPFLVVREDVLSHGKATTTKPTWVSAEELKSCDYLVSPITKKTKRPADNCIIMQDIILSPITEITANNVTNLPVYNLSVATDESYIVHGFAVHNCSICGHCAPSRKEYCDHAKHQLGDLLSNGKRVFVWNPSPKFFDLSIVRRPADRLGYMMKKVAEVQVSSAELGEYVTEATEKAAKLRKLSIIQKVLSGSIPVAKTDDHVIHAVKNFANTVAFPTATKMPPLDDETIRQLVAYHPAEVMSTLASMGILLTTPEFIKYFIGRIAPGVEVSDEQLTRIIAAQHRIFDLLADRPDLLEELESSGWLTASSDHVNKELAEKISVWIPERTQLRSTLIERMFGLAGTKPDPVTGYVPGMFDVVSVRDPFTGKIYQTTQAAVRRTHGLARMQRAKDILGGGALLAGGLALTPLRGIRYAFPLLSVPGIHRLGRGIHGYPYVPTITGERIYLPARSPYGRTYFRGTELAEKRSSAHEFGLADVIIKMAMEFAHYPGARNKKIAAFSYVDANFEKAASQIGGVICS